MDSSAATIVCARGLVKRYGAKIALDGLNLDVSRAQIFGLLGPNGAGKTTTIEILEGLREPDEGRVLVFGNDIRRHRRAIMGRVGIQLQSTYLYPFLTVRELIELFSNLYPNTRKVDEVMSLLGLNRIGNELLRHLSGGQARRVHLSLAWINDPDLLFLDEPSAGLDAQGRHAVWELINHARALGRTVFLTTHYIEEAERLCDHIAIVDHGRIIASGRPRSLIKEHFGESVAISPNGGTEIPSAPKRGPNLEDVFLKLTGREVRR